MLYNSAYLGKEKNKIVKIFGFSLSMSIDKQKGI